jgi:hypothetical protein
MSDLEMIQVGTDVHNKPVYNVKRKGGGLVSTTIFTEAEALAMLEAPKEAPEVEEAPVEEEEVEEEVEEEEEEEVEEEVEEEETSEVPDYSSMTKLQLESLMREHDIELDRRLTKSDLLEQVDSYFKANFSN